MFYELRLYTVVPGRLEDNHDRFQNHLPRLMERHGIANVGRWTAVAGPNAPMFVYMMAYRDLDERERQWGAFYQDNDWWELRGRTNAGSQMVERFDLFFLRSNPVWSPKPASSTRAQGVHELIFAEIALGHNAAANVFLSQTWLPLVEQHGGHVMMVSDFVSGVSMPRAAIMTAWPDASTRFAARRAIDGDPALRAAQKAERESLGRTSLGRTDVFELEPTAFDLPLSLLGYQP